MFNTLFPPELRKAPFPGRPALRATVIFLNLIVWLFISSALPANPAQYPELLQLSLAQPGKKSDKKFESEHGPLPKRTYWLNASLAATARGLILHPDGSSGELEIAKKDGGSFVQFDSPWKSESMHGPNSVYVFDRAVLGDTLYVRTAKWIVIHHNCAWGHPFKYNQERLTPRGMEKVPLEIVPEALWDGNFHVKTETGMNLTLQVLSYGKPAANAHLTVMTHRGWQKEMVTDGEGKVSFQLIRDYYPRGWENFHRTHLDSLLFVARLEVNRSGALNAHPYRRELLTTSLPWRYRPAQADYTSLAWGLAIGFITIAFSLAAVLIYRERRKKPLRRLHFNE